MSKANSSIRTLSAAISTAIDNELMSSGAFSIDQLMELAGLSVAQAVYKQSPPKDTHHKVLILVGPGNNGGDGLVAARHLKLFGYEPSVYYPKKSKNELYTRLQIQLKNMNVRFVEDDQEIETEIAQTHHIVDAIFGFSFKPPIREPFPKIINLLKQTKTHVTSVDIPSSWDVDKGPGEDAFHPTALVSLTAPKPASKYFKGLHYLGGRFVGKEFAQKYGIDVPEYEGVDQVVQIYSVV